MQAKSRPRLDKGSIRARSGVKPYALQISRAGSYIDMAESTLRALMRDRGIQPIKVSERISLIRTADLERLVDDMAGAE